MAINEMAIDYLQRAITLMQNEDYAGAITYAEKAILIDKRYKEAYVVKADALVNQERYEDALKVYNQAALIEPNDGELYFNIGNLYVLLDDVIKCIKNYNKADQLGFRYYGLYKNLADIYRQIEKSDLALVNYNKAISVEPLRADIRLEKAGYQILLGKFTEALESLEELQMLEPDLYDAIVMRAEIYSGLKQYGKAIDVLNEAISQYPDDSALCVEKAKILLNSGKVDEAYSELQAIKKMENFEQVFRGALLVEAQILSSRGDLKQTKVALEEIVEKQDEYDEEVQYLLLNICFALEQYEKASDIARTLAARENENLYTMSAKFYVPQIMQKIGKSADALNEYRRLSSYFRRVTVNNPHFYEVYLYRLLCHKELGEYEKALELADYIEHLNPSSSDAFAMRYAIYRDMKDDKKAEEMRQVVAKINPGLQL